MKFPLPEESQDGFSERRKNAQAVFRKKSGSPAADINGFGTPAGDESTFQVFQIGINKLSSGLRQRVKSAVAAFGSAEWNVEIVIHQKGKSSSAAFWGAGAGGFFFCSAASKTAGSTIRDCSATPLTSTARRGRTGQMNSHPPHPIQSSGVTLGMVRPSL